MVIVGSIVFYPLRTKEFTLQIKNLLNISCLCKIGIYFANKKATTHHEQPLHKLPCFNLYT